MPHGPSIRIRFDAFGGHHAAWSLDLHPIRCIWGVPCCMVPRFASDEEGRPTRPNDHLDVIQGRTRRGRRSRTRTGAAGRGGRRCARWSGILDDAVHLRAAADALHGDEPQYPSAVHGAAATLPALRRRRSAVMPRLTVEGERSTDPPRLVPFDTDHCETLVALVGLGGLLSGDPARARHRPTACARGAEARTPAWRSRSRSARPRCLTTKGWSHPPDLNR